MVREEAGLQSVPPSLSGGNAHVVHLIAPGQAFEVLHCDPDTTATMSAAIASPAACASSARTCRRPLQASMGSIAGLTRTSLR